MVTKDELRELSLHGIIGFAARCTRRVLPIAALQREAGKITPIIDIATAFARGDPVPLSEARRIVAAGPLNRDSNYESFPRKPEDNLLEVERAAFHLGRATASAFGARLDSPPIRSSAEEALSSAYDAVREAALATEPFVGTNAPGQSEYKSFVRQDPKRASDAEAARQALRRDFSLMKDYSGGQWFELGPPVDVTEMGPLGPLWRELPPRWYREGTVLLGGGPQIASVEEFEEAALLRIRAQRGTSGLDALCWTLSPGEPVGRVLEDVGRVRAACEEIGSPPPALVVFAPDADDEARNQLTMAGVFLFDSESRGRPAGIDSLRAWFERERWGWEPLRGTWGPETPGRIFHLQDEREQDPRDIDPSYEDEPYEALLRTLQREPWWKMEY